MKEVLHEAYRIGWVPFLGVRVDLSGRPLIPRPETEFWTEHALAALRARGVAAARVLDLFCGSGCIGLAILKHVRGARVTFADIEPAYSAGIRKSMRMNRIAPGRAQIATSDMFSKLDKKKFDFVLANPPYIAARGRYIAKSVLRQEPHAALFAGADGLKYISKLLREGARHLAPGGAMYIEFDTPQKQRIAALATRHGWDTAFYRDQYRRWRWVIVTPCAPKRRTQPQQKSRR